MTKKKSTAAWWLWLILLVSSSCKQGMMEYYERPDWIKGNCFEVLSAEGNYKLFLQGIERCGYRDMVDGKSIVTVMAPNDSAFSAYLKDHGYESVSEMDSVELDKLIGFHLMYYAYGADRLMNFRPKEGDDVSDDEKKVNAGLYYKHRTKSKDPNSIEFDNARGIDVEIYHQERFLPVFSNNYFTTKQIDAESNYHYFFPETPWSNQFGYNVANAAVTQGEIITSNGYVHKIDRVLTPLKTIYDELRSREEFSDFLTLYKQYEYFAYDEDLTLQYGNGKKLYQHLFISPMANIASEWPSTDYSKMTELSSIGYSVFAPTNRALNTFFQNYWEKGGYASLNEVSRESVQKLLFNCVYADDIAFPEEIHEGRIENSYGTIIDFDTETVPQKYRLLCENGLFYGCEEMAVPAMFASITGPAYQYKDYSYYLKMLTAIGDIQNTLWSDETRMLSLMPSNEQVMAKGITVDREGNLVIDAKPLSGAFKTNTVYAHLVDLSSSVAGDTELNAAGLQVLKTFSPDQTFYWYVKDGRLTNSYAFNQRIYPEPKTDEEIFMPFAELASYKEDGTWSNGKSYSYEGPMLIGDPAETTYRRFQAMMYNNKVDEKQPYHAFVNLLLLADMYKGESFNFTTESCLMTIPTNEAVAKALNNGLMPGLSVVDDLRTDTTHVVHACVVDSLEELASYLKQYFVPLNTSGMTNYPFLGWNERTEKGMATLDVKEVIGDDYKVRYEGVFMDVVDTGSSLEVSLRKEGTRKAHVVEDYHYLPFIFSDGCVHFIDTCF